MSTKPNIALTEYINLLKSAKINANCEQLGSTYVDDREVHSLYVTNQISENGMDFSYTMYFNHPRGKPYLLSDPQEAEHGAWFEPSFAFDVMGEDGREMDTDELIALAAEHTDITRLEVPDHVRGPIEVEDLTVGNVEFKIVQRDDDLDIHHNGELIGEAERDDQRFHETLRIYELSDGSFVTEAIEIAKFYGTTDTHDGRHCQNKREVMEFYNERWSHNLVLEVLEDAGIGAPTDNDEVEDEDEQPDLMELLDDNAAEVLSEVWEFDWPWNESGTGTLEVRGVNVDWEQKAENILEVDHLDEDERADDWFQVDYSREIIIDSADFSITMTWSEAMRAPCRKREHYNAFFEAEEPRFSFCGDESAAFAWLRTFI